MSDLGQTHACYLPFIVTELNICLKCSTFAYLYYNLFCWFVFFPSVSNTFGSSCSTVITFYNDARRLGWAIREAMASE